MEKLTERESAIEVEMLVKTYGTLKAVNSISFAVKQGQVFAFLGPNGAGKTTTVEILECLRMPSQGKANVLGYDVTKREGQKQIRKRIGVLPENFSAFDLLTVKENLVLFGEMFDSHVDADELIELVNLEERTNELFKNLSSGLKQRVGVAAALVNDPDVVFLDEPTSGLDPKARRDTWNLIKRLRTKGKTVFLTTHYMEEAQELADTVAIIDYGEIIARGTPNMLIDEYGGDGILVVRSGGEKVEKMLSAKFPGLEIKSNGDVLVPIREENDVMEAVLEMGKSGIGLKELEIWKSNLEQVFLNLTGKKVKPYEKSPSNLCG